MIGSLRGLLLDASPLSAGGSEVLVEVGGVGYRVLVGPSTAAALPAPGASVSLRVHTHVRESAITLYGFAAADELQAFELLLGAHGVGPALALAVLGALPPGELARAVVAGDLDALSRVPGVGRKTAARLVVDLGPRFESFAGTAPAAAPAVQAASGGPRPSVHDQVGAALASLGYASDEVRAALAALPGEGDLESLLKAALVELAPALTGSRLGAGEAR